MLKISVIAPPTPRYYQRPRLTANMYHNVLFMYLPTLIIFRTCHWMYNMLNSCETFWRVLCIKSEFFKWVLPLTINKFTDCSRRPSLPHVRAHLQHGYIFLDFLRSCFFSFILLIFMRKIGRCLDLTPGLRSGRNLNHSVCSCIYLKRFVYERRGLKPCFFYLIHLSRIYAGE